MSGYRLWLRAAGLALLGGLGERQPGVNAASAILPDDDGPGNGGRARMALLLGSSLKGVLRHDAARFAEARGQATCRAQPHGCGDCIVCRVFGAPNHAGKLAVRSARAAARDLVVASSVGIDRRTRTADRAGRRLWSELRSGIPPVYDIRDHAAVVSDLYRRVLAARRSGRVGAGTATPSEEVFSA